MSEVNVLWSSAWLKLQKSLAKSSRSADFGVAGSICDPQAQDTASTAGSWLVRAPRGILQESSLSR